MHSFFKQHVGPVMLLLAIILLPRVWVASQAVAPNKDAIRYWAAADLFILHSPFEAIRSLDSLPVYPAVLSLIKLAGWASTPELWWRSSQVLGIASYSLFLVSAYLAGSMMVGAPRAWWGCVLVSLLPRQLRYSVDILADNLLVAFLWVALLLWWWVVDRSKSRAWLLVVSLLLGFATLTRPEGYLWIGALLLATPLTGWGRGESGTSVVASIACLVAPLLILVGSYSLIRGEIAPSNTGRAMLGVTTRGNGPVKPTSRLRLMRGSRRARVPFFQLPVRGSSLFGNGLKRRAFCCFSSFWSESLAAGSVSVAADG